MDYLMLDSVTLHSAITGAVMPIKSFAPLGGDRKRESGYKRPVVVTEVSSSQRGEQK